jgi:uncharacterized protein YkwD
MTSALPFRASRSGASLARIAIAAVVLTAALSVVGPVSHPARVEASTASYMEGLLAKWINDARASKGIPKLTIGTKLTDLAGDRAATMASNNKLAHPSCLGCLLNARNISWTTCGEVIAGTTYPWGYDAARSIFNAWKGSSGHWGILMSRNFTRIGLGVAYRSSNHNTFAAGVLARG